MIDDSADMTVLDVHATLMPWSGHGRGGQLTAELSLTPGQLLVVGADDAPLPENYRDLGVIQTRWTGPGEGRRLPGGVVRIPLRPFDLNLRREGVHDLDHLPAIVAEVQYGAHSTAGPRSDRPFTPSAFVVTVDGRDARGPVPVAAGRTSVVELAMRTGDSLHVFLRLALERSRSIPTSVMPRATKLLPQDVDALRSLRRVYFASTIKYQLDSTKPSWLRVLLLTADVAAEGVSGDALARAVAERTPDLEPGEVRTRWRTAVERFRHADVVRSWAEVDAQDTPVRVSTSGRHAFRSVADDLLAHIGEPVGTSGRSVSPDLMALLCRRLAKAFGPGDPGFLPPRSAVRTSAAFDVWLRRLA